MDTEQKDQKLLRRKFLKQTGLVATGVDAGAVGLNATLQAEANETDAPPEWPWPYKVLDVELVRKRGHQYYYKGGCMYGVTGGPLSVLIEKTQRQARRSTAIRQRCCRCRACSAIQVGKYSPDDYWAFNTGDDSDVTTALTTGFYIYIA